MTRGKISKWFEKVTSRSNSYDLVRNRRFATFDTLPNSSEVKRKCRSVSINHIDVEFEFFQGTSKNESKPSDVPPQESNEASGSSKDVPKLGKRVLLGSEERSHKDKLTTHLTEVSTEEIFVEKPANDLSTGDASCDCFTNDSSTSDSSAGRTMATCKKAMKKLLKSPGRSIALLMPGRRRRTFNTRMREYLSRGPVSRYLGCCGVPPASSSTSLSDDTTKSTRTSSPVSKDVSKDFVWDDKPKPVLKFDNVEVCGQSTLERPLRSYPGQADLGQSYQDLKALQTRSESDLLGKSVRQESTVNKDDLEKLFSRDGFHIPVGLKRSYSLDESLLRANNVELEAVDENKNRKDLEDAPPKEVEDSFNESKVFLDEFEKENDNESYLGGRAPSSCSIYLLCDDIRKTGNKKTGWSSIGTRSPRSSPVHSDYKRRRLEDNQMSCSAPDLLNDPWDNERDFVKPRHSYSLSDMPIEVLKEENCEDRASPIKEEIDDDDVAFRENYMLTRGNAGLEALRTLDDSDASYVISMYV